MRLISLKYSFPKKVFGPDKLYVLIDYLVTLCHPNNPNFMSPSILNLRVNLLFSRSPYFVFVSQHQPSAHAAAVLCCAGGWAASVLAFCLAHILESILE